MSGRKKVLIPLNFSVKTFYVLQFVLKKANLFDWSVFIILSFENDKSENKEDIDQKLEHLMRQAKNDFPLVHIRGEAIQGDILQFLLDLNRSEHFDLIVSGQYADILHYASRDLTEGLVEQCYTPVLVLPESQHLPNLRHVGVMTSFHENEIESIKLVEQLFDGKLDITVFHVANEEKKELAYERMREWELDIRGNIEKVDIHFLVVEADTVLEGVKRAINEEDIDVLVVTSIAKTFVKKILSKNLFKELTQVQVMRPTLFVKCD
ncbi:MULTISPECIES: hypothetical protein [Olivibacter]|jgi:nucleotide-binding universal stress UspA family protein|uniref:Nucleotide-binding universal stress UspA family protein n=1 Tax=Olivibacter jilunii TaxID=985016 RepID=A0ABW6AXL1_9SPHI|nr:MULTISPECIES: hypothetical protein [unclassified Olivibacter]MDM8175552.1 hypothetical protein [Olivibacter sp. 47]MDX3914161.1 hypothetical protein [Pseudosphingobacterium sp.]QEL02298.1 hypothetical protein FKG96_16270 [Olivibacter sp. LS-1]